MQLKLEIIERIHLKEYGFFSFEINMGNNLSYKYGQKLLDIAKKSTMDAIKTASKRAIQKAAEATGDSIGNKTADKITIVSGKSKELPNDETDVERGTPKKRYISSEKRQRTSNN